MKNVFMYILVRPRAQTSKYNKTKEKKKTTLFLLPLFHLHTHEESASIDTQSLVHTEDSPVCCDAFIFVAVLRIVFPTPRIYGTTTFIVGVPTV